MTTQRTPGDRVRGQDAMTVTFTVTGLERIEGHGRLVALAAVEIEFDGVVLGLAGIQVMRRRHRITTQAPRFRDPRTGAWEPAIILPDELGEAIAQELHRMLRHKPGRIPDDAPLAEVFGIPLEQLIDDSLRGMWSK